jgi:hypothetical protein
VRASSRGQIGEHLSTTLAAMGKVRYQSEVWEGYRVLP